MSDILQPMQSTTSSVQDITTPWDVTLSAKYKKSFAYTTIKDRLPVILTKVIDGLSRDKEAIAEEYGEEGREDVKRVISCLAQLKNEMVTDKVFTQLACGEDKDKWNGYLRSKTEDGTTVSWFSTVWLYAECYFYRRLKEAFLMSKKLSEYDPFLKQKTDCLESALGVIGALAEHLVKLVEAQDLQTKEEVFRQFLKHSLWANKVDLSMSNGNDVEIKSDFLKLVDNLEDHLLVDDSKEIWLEISRLSNVKDLVVDIVLDNSGMELLADLCFAEVLTSMFKTSRVRFHCKAIPWFVSDVMERDFRQTIERLANHTPACQRLAAKWKGHLNQGKWVLLSEPFWTMPYGYSEMKVLDPQLYTFLQESSIIFMKGDLNYRKLLGDVNWQHSTPFHTALGGFRPALVAAVRTAKADLVAGVPADVSVPVVRRDPHWLITGEYGLIQLAKTPREQS